MQKDPHPERHRGKRCVREGWREMRPFDALRNSSTVRAQSKTTKLRQAGNRQVPRTRGHPPWYAAARKYARCRMRRTGAQQRTAEPVRCRARPPIPAIPKGGPRRGVLRRIELSATFLMSRARPVGQKAIRASGSCVTWLNRLACITTWRGGRAGSEQPRRYSRTNLPMQARVIRFDRTPLTVPSILDIVPAASWSKKSKQA